MKPYRLVCCCLLLAVLCVAGTAAGQKIWVPTLPSNDANTRRGHDDFYNLEYDKALSEFQAAQQAHPDDPFAANHILTTIIFKELFRIGALDTEAFAGDAFLNRPSVTVDPSVTDQVAKQSDHALALSQAILDKDGNNVDALYARAVTKGLRATYQGIGQKAWLAALRSAVGARHDDERVLELDPNYADAKTAIGVDLYIVGSLSWPIKVAASVTGITGSKSKGLQYLREAAANGRISSTDAKIALALFLRREQKYDEAIQVVAGLTSAYPRNFLMANEYAFLQNASGHGPQAIAAFRKVIAGCRSNAYTVCRIEVPAWGLGEALRGQRDYAGAAEAYELAAANSPDKHLRQRATLAAGEMYDMLKKRDAALDKYRAVIAADSSSQSADSARHYMKEAYTTP